jgi:YesN/AraC family two-component response regulator
MGYDEVSNNLHEYIEININELESEDQWKNNMYFGKKFKKQ